MIDELGYLTYSADAANVLFQVVDPPLGRLQEAAGHGLMITITGKSYRQRNQQADTKTAKTRKKEDQAC